jgi:diadenosine tetraphosphate (Ap4A) HIT family hydrolase
MSCLFCEISNERIVAENDLAYAVHDGFPVTELHTLIIPKRHVEDYFGLTQEELLACDDISSLNGTYRDIIKNSLL